MKPDIKVLAAQAQQTAYVGILRTLVAAGQMSDPRDAERLRKLLALAGEGGE